MCFCFLVQYVTVVVSSPHVKQPHVLYSDYFYLTVIFLNLKTASVYSWAHYLPGFESTARLRTKPRTHPVHSTFALFTRMCFSPEGKVVFARIHEPITALNWLLLAWWMVACVWGGWVRKCLTICDCKAGYCRYWSSEILAGKIWNHETNRSEKAASKNDLS